MTDTLSALTSSPLLPLPSRWRVPEQMRLLDEARTAEAQGADHYWAWAAKHQRWHKSWDVLREGSFGNLRYYVGGLLNVADNCVDRHAEDPARSTRDAIIWEGEPGDVRRLTYRDLREQVSRFANGLRSLGIGRGDVVAIIFPICRKSLWQSRPAIASAPYTPSCSAGSRRTQSRCGSRYPMPSWS